MQSKGRKCHRLTLRLERVTLRMTEWATYDLSLTVNVSLSRNSTVTLLDCLTCHIAFVSHCVSLPISLCALCHFVSVSDKHQFCTVPHFQVLFVPLLVTFKVADVNGILLARWAFFNALLAVTILVHNCCPIRCGLVAQPLSLRTTDLLLPIDTVSASETENKCTL